jgi:hypothetical protein
VHLFTNMNTHICLLAAAFIYGAATQIQAAAPAMTSYQGRVQVSGTNFNGTGQFKFAIIENVGGSSIWSNDGTSADGSEPTAAVSIDVTNGLFTVLLGDDSLANMLPLTADMFSINGTTSLRVWFDDGVNGSAQLTPDTRLASVPYALSADIADGSITVPKLNVANAPQVGRLLSYDGVGFDWVDGTVAGNIWSLALNGSDTYYVAGNVGIGTNAPTAGYRLDVNGSTRLAPGGNGGAILFGSPNFETGLTIQGNARADLRFDGSAVKLVAGPLGGPPSSANGIAVTTTGKVGIGTTTPAAKLTVRSGGPIITDLYGIEHTDGTVRLSTYIDPSGGWLGTVTTHPLKFYVRNGQASMSVDTNGNIVMTPNGGNGGYGSTVFGSPSGESGMSIRGADVGGNRADLRFNGTSVKLVAGPGIGPPGLSSGVAVTIGGNVGIGTDNPLAKLHVEAPGAAEATIKGASERAILSLNSTLAGQNQVWTLESGLFGTPGLFGIYDRTVNRARLTIDSGGVVGVDALQIRGGADLSEHFDVKAVVDSVRDGISGGTKPGMVARIDPENPGKLVISSEAYDRRVAGIISGAGGVKPGMVMSQDGTIADGTHPVALTGRVYCYVDASYGAITPGDLLTTSDTPGHAMRVVDHARAQGAILGKAMTALKEGRGMVLVLVTLQ